jgi:4-aminobutyrate aminotransferase
MTKKRTATEAGSKGHSSQLLPELKGPLPGPRARAIIKRDQAVMSPSYTRDDPFVMERGDGAVVWDADGNRFLDLAAGIAVCATGHSNPHVVAAISEQAGKFLHMSGTDYYYDVQIRLAERLCAYAPIKGAKKTFFTNSGTESIEGAIKLARHHTHGHQMLAFYGAFHGRTMGALSLTASKSVQRKSFSPFLPGVVHVPFGEPVERIENYVIKKMVDTANFAALFVEPIQGEGGYLIPTTEWMQGLRDLCNRYNILLVADEVQSGMGRTGKMFACEHFGVQPDILCLAKGIASGLPLGAFISRADIMTWEPGMHGTTFGGNPVCCAAAHATLDLLEKSLLKNARVMGAHFKQRLEQLCDKHRSIKGARGLGLMLAVDVVDKDGQPAPKARNEIVHRAFEQGILLLGCGSSAIRFCPPLVVTKEQVDFGVDALDGICGKIAG